MENKLVLAQLAVDEIVYDLSDRRGMGQQWDGIDNDIKEEIKEVWTKIIVKMFENGQTNPSQV
jgi:hypothetical protein